MFQYYDNVILLFTFVLPLLWWAIMFTIQCGHWLWAWIDDSTPTTNILMNFAMVHLLNYENNYTNVASMYINEQGSRCNGATAIWVPAIYLAFVPVTIALSVDFAWVVLFGFMVVGLLYGTRKLRRLSKIVTQHINDVGRHNNGNR